MVYKELRLTYRDGQATYAITVGSKGHTTPKVGQTTSSDVVHLNRLSYTYKHSLQSFYTYVHDEHTKLKP